MDKIIEFQGKYRWLSNFWPCEFLVWGYTFPSAEHAYQAAKAPQLTEQWHAIRTAMSPGAAKRLGAKVQLSHRWDETTRLSTMLDVVRAKFMQNPELAERLSATHDALLEEGNRWGDRFWGVSPAGTRNGRNELGKIIMHVRSELKSSGE